MWSIVPASLLASSRARAEAPAVVAVFDIECRDVKLAQNTLLSLSEVLAAKLTGSGAYQVIPSSDLRSRLQSEKASSYKSCFDQACQISIGKELAAQKSLSTRVMRIAKKCVTTSTLFDLARATTERAATAEGECSEDGIMASINAIAKDLSEAKKPAATAPAPAASPEVLSPPHPAAVDPHDPKVFENWKIIDGNWEMKNGALHGSGGAIRWPELMSDGAIEVDVELIRGEAWPAQSVVWRAGAGRGYGVNWQSRGAYNVFVGSNESWRCITSPPRGATNQDYKVSPLIDDTLNHVRVEFTGPAYKIFFNGKLLDQGSDETHLSGRVGFWVQEARSVVKFSNITITKLK